MTCRCSGESLEQPFNHNHVDKLISDFRVALGRSNNREAMLHVSAQSGDIGNEDVGEQLFVLLAWAQSLSRGGVGCHIDVYRIILTG